MDPVCLYIFGKPIYWYGIMVALGFLAAVVHLTLLGKRDGRPAAFGSDLAFWLMLSGVLGGRVAYVLADLDYFLREPWAIIRIDQGGLIYYGGFIAAFFAGFIFARLHRIAFPDLADYAITAVPLGHAFGRIGCFLNGCCGGKVSNVPWAVFQHGACRHPVQLYEALINLVIYVLLLAVYCRRRRSGEVLALYCMTYGAARFFLEFLRDDERLVSQCLSIGQIVSLALFAVGAIIWIGSRRLKISER